MAISIAEKRLKAAIYAAYPGIDSWDSQDAIDYAASQVEEILQAADAVTFSEENINRSYPYVYGFLKRRGYTPIGKEVHVLIDYVIRGLREGYGVERQN